MARCQVNLAKETDGEYCWLSSVGSNDALSDVVFDLGLLLTVSFAFRSIVPSRTCDVSV